MQRLRARRIGFIFQSFRLLDPLNVTDNLILAGEFAGLSRTRAVTNAHEVLHKLEIDHLAGAFPSQLSQGEKQRVATARALINRPSLLIADEPTASLESKQAMLLVELLVNYVKSSDGGLLVATHDLRILPFADRVIRIEDGVLSADFPNNDYRPKLKETPVQ
jgi:ABC-type lipoprotein export system ATPase subunit